MKFPMHFPRYLVPFHPKHIPHHFVDVLVIGGGIAGLRAVMSIDPQLSTLVVTKDQLRESSSSYAQGGIASVVRPEDSFDSHVADTLVAGAQLCDRKVVEMVIREAPGHIRQLIEWGTCFDQDTSASTGQKSFILGREGGHSHFRIVHALGDATGKEIMRALIHQARYERKVQIWQDTFTIDLLTHDLQAPDNGSAPDGTESSHENEASCQGHQGAQCCGALVWNPHHGKTFIWAKQTILCTGGAGQIYRETTNPPIATADGHAIAFRAGAKMMDMEFMQFHPTVLYIAGSSRSLITEAMRGEGALLVDADGHRFMPAYDDRAELAPRDIVSQAIVKQMEKTHHPCVYLDLSHLDPVWVHHRFPGISSRCKEFGIDIATDRIPIRPGAHYMIGGVAIDPHGRTSLPGLWAAGEVASSGLHGANRLASNSLLEGLVYGAHAGAGASAAAMQQPDSFQAIPLVHPKTASHDERLDLLDIRNSLKSLMWRAAGVQRSGVDLRAAGQTIDTWCQYALTRQLPDPVGWELQNMLTMSRIVIAGALRREESRGVHFRTDFPDPDDSRWGQRLATALPTAATKPEA
jgi:L-aspartate oxidase